MDRIFRQPSGDRETSPEIHDFARHSDKSSKEAGESQDTNVGEKRPLSASSDKSRLDKKPRPGQEEPGSADFYASQFIPESEGAYSLLEGGHMDKQPGAIEMRPLERYAGRYETEVGLPNSKGYVPVKTKVQGESRISYESMVNLKEGDFHVIEAWRLRTSDDTIHGEDYAYDSEAHKDGEPMNYSDIVYAHIAEAIKKHGERYGISQVSEFKLERFVVEPPVFNKSTVDTFKSLVEPGGSEDFERGSKEFDTGMKTPFGKALEHLLEQRYPDREVVAVGADRESDRIIEGAEHISLELQFYVEEKG